VRSQHVVPQDTPRKSPNLPRSTPNKNTYAYIWTAYALMSSAACGRSDIAWFTLTRSRSASRRRAKGRTNSVLLIGNDCVRKPESVTVSINYIPSTNSSIVTNVNKCHLEWSVVRLGFDEFHAAYMWRAERDHRFCAWNGYWVERYLIYI